MLCENLIQKEMDHAEHTLNTCKRDSHPISHTPSADTCYCPYLNHHLLLHFPSPAHCAEKQPGPRNIMVCTKSLPNSLKKKKVLLKVQSFTQTTCCLLFLTIPPGAGYHRCSDSERGRREEAPGLWCHSGSCACPARGTGILPPQESREHPAIPISHTTAPGWGYTRLYTPFLEGLASPSSRRGGASPQGESRRSPAPPGRAPPAKFPPNFHFL